MSAEELEKLHDLLARQSAELGNAKAELDHFSSVIAHDLQEPLRMITGYLHLLQSQYGSKLDGDANEFIAYAMDGAKRMQVLINDLLTYSRLGTRGKPFEVTDCNDVLGAALFNLMIAIRESGAHVTHDPLPAVLGDKVQLGQLFQNLLGNAIKYRDNRPLEIHVGCERDGDVWRLFVRDNGIGIDPEHAQRIFVIFQRLHTRQEYPGTGVGLAICKRIVERHGGIIWVESEPRKGATFYFTLPPAEAVIARGQNL
jgi:light-regulated signal transduction histidine kinase (bacteriophytochrome)